MTQEQSLFAIVNLAVCAVIWFICVCRLNAMKKDVLLRVRSEYAALLVAAVASGLQPLYGEFPGWASLGMSCAVLAALIFSSHAWRKGDKDKVPAIATNHPGMETK